MAQVKSLVFSKFKLLSYYQKWPLKQAWIREIYQIWGFGRPNFKNKISAQYQKTFKTVCVWFV